MKGFILNSLLYSQNETFHQERGYTMSRRSDELRLDVIKMGYAAGSGHMGGSLSCAEILSVLFEKELRHLKESGKRENRDRLILSKGHAAPMLYACMAKEELIPRELLWTLRDLGSPLQGHPTMHSMPYLDMSAGSLGMGLSVAVGMALALRGRDIDVYVVLGDGELQEGQNWEAFMSLKSFDLCRVHPIIDQNNVQLDAPTAVIQPNQASIAAKLKGFGLHVAEVDGHDEDQLHQAFAWGRKVGTPHALVAHTTKGKGVSYMEGQAKWHGRALTAEEYQTACEEINKRLVYA